MSERSRTRPETVDEAFVEGDTNSFCIGQQVGDNTPRRFHVSLSKLRAVGGPALAREMDGLWFYEQCKEQTSKLCQEITDGNPSQHLGCFAEGWDDTPDDADRGGLHFAFYGHGSHYWQGRETSDNDCIIPWSVLLAEGYVDPCSPWRDLWEARR